MLSKTVLYLNPSSQHLQSLLLHSIHSHLAVFRHMSWGRVIVGQNYWGYFIPGLFTANMNEEFRPYTYFYAWSWLSGYLHIFSIPFLLLYLLTWDTELQRMIWNFSPSQSITFSHCLRIFLHWDHKEQKINPSKNVSEV